MLLRRGKRETPGEEEYLWPRLKHSNRQLPLTTVFGSEFQVSCISFHSIPYAAYRSYVHTHSDTLAGLTAVFQLNLDYRSTLIFLFTVHLSHSHADKGLLNSGMRVCVLIYLCWIYFLQEIGGNELL